MLDKKWKDRHHRCVDKKDHTSGEGTAKVRMHGRKIEGVNVDVTLNSNSRYEERNR